MNLTNALDDVRSIIGTSNCAHLMTSTSSVIEKFLQKVTCLEGLLAKYQTCLDLVTDKHVSILWRVIHRVYGESPLMLSNVFLLSYQ